MFSRCDNECKITVPLEAEVIPVLHSVAEANTSDESDGVAKQEDEQIGIFQILDKLEEAVDALPYHKFKPGASKTGSKDQADQIPLLHPVFQVFCPEIKIENTYESSFWGETAQLLTVFKVICPCIYVESTFKKHSFWGETLQLLTVFKVFCPFICVQSTFKSSFWRETL